MAEKRRLFVSRQRVRGARMAEVTSMADAQRAALEDAMAFEMTEEGEFYDVLAIVGRLWVGPRAEVVDADTPDGPEVHADE